MHFEILVEDISGKIALNILMIDLENMDEQIEQVRQTSQLKFYVEPRAIKAYYSTDNTIVTTGIIKMIVLKK